jgi:Tfp pilus assembly protein PilP
MKHVLVICLLLVMVAGCSAGTSADLLTYDAIEASARQIQAGVTAYDASVQADQAKMRQQIVTALGDDVLEIAQKQMTAEDASKLRAAVIVKMTEHLDNLSEQDRRRREVYEPTMDNIAYILQLCEQGRQFTLYRSSVEQQWKTYLQATARANIKAIPTTQGAN